MDMPAQVPETSAVANRPRPEGFSRKTVPPTNLLAADGSVRLPHVAYDDDGYPYSDGAPLAQSSAQADQLYYAFPASQAWLRARFPNAFAASDMLVYPKRGDLKAAVAPDILVAFDAGDHARDSYKLFEGEPVPAFVLEVLSGTTADNDLGEKREEYAAMGVLEYWLVDPFGDRVRDHVAGHRLFDRRYLPISPQPGTRVYRSGVLGLEFRAEDGQLRIRDPATGEDLLGYAQERAARLLEKARADAAEAEVRRLRAVLDADARQQSP